MALGAGPPFNIQGEAAEVFVGDKLFISTRLVFFFFLFHSPLEIIYLKKNSTLPPLEIEWWPPYSVRLWLENSRYWIRISSGSIVYHRGCLLYNGPNKTIQEF